MSQRPPSAHSQPSGSSDPAPAAGSHTSARARAKIVSHAELLQRRRHARAMGLRVVHCHGCFDIVHPGHIRHLRQAKSHGELLLVTITGDASYAKRQGAPLIPEHLRAENLAELDCVDWVYIEPRPTAAELLDEVAPDIYVKGREYENNADPRFAAERSTVERHGGRVVFSSGDVVFSSTALIAALERSVDPYHSRLSQLLAHPQLDGPTLNAAVNRFRGQRVLVIGETIIDTYVLCDQPEVAAESPVMTLRPLERRTYDGGAAILARHIAAMGGRPTLLTGMPRGNPIAQAATERLSREGVDVRCIETDQPLAEKQRFLVGAQKVMKLNLLEPIVLDAQRQNQLITTATELASDDADPFDAAIIADFGNGLLSPALVTNLCLNLRPRVRVLTGDVSGRRASLRAFHGCDLLSPSEPEARQALQVLDQSLPAVAWTLLQQTNSKAALITLGGDGLVAFDRLEPRPADAASSGDNPSRVRGEHIPALSGFPVDPLGCGDSLLAATTLALAAGCSTLAASFLGSLAAAAQAQRLGNIPISASDLRAGLVRLHTARLTFDPADDRPANTTPAAHTHAQAHAHAL